MNLKCFLIVTLFVATKSCGDHYWRDYDGRIPSDAIPAGKNYWGLSYIGQAYIHNYGLLLGTIIPGNLTVNVPCYGVKTTDVIIKILCAPSRKNYYWLWTNSTAYQKDTAGKCPVLGGYDQNVKGNIKLGTLHVGRTFSEGEVIIGNIAAYNPGHPLFYYPLHGSEISTTNYEVLMYSYYPIGVSHNVKEK